MMRFQDGNSQIKNGRNCKGMVRSGLARRGRVWHGEAGQGLKKLKSNNMPPKPARLARQCKICGFPYFVDEDELVDGICRGCREGQRGMSCREIHERRKVWIKI